MSVAGRFHASLPVLRIMRDPISLYSVYTMFNYSPPCLKVPDNLMSENVASTSETHIHLAHQLSWAVCIPVMKKFPRMDTEGPLVTYQKLSIRSLLQPVHAVHILTIHFSNAQFPEEFHLTKFVNLTTIAVRASDPTSALISYSPMDVNANAPK